MMLILSMPASCVANACASSGILSTTMLMHRRVVEVLPRLGLPLQALGLGEQLLLDDLRLGLADGEHLGGFGPADPLDLRGLAGALVLELLLRRFGADDRRLLLALRAQDRRLPLGLGRLDDRRLQLLLACAPPPAPGRALPAACGPARSGVSCSVTCCRAMAVASGPACSASACLAWTAASNSACLDSLSRSDCAIATSAS